MIENTYKHKGEGKFEAILEDGSIKEVGPNICGMIRYTYFQDYTLPPIDWEVNGEQLFKDYHTKVSKDIFSGKISDDSKDDYIEKL